MSLPENRDYQYNRTMMTFYAFMSVINIGLGLSGALMVGGTGVACGCLAFLQSRHVVLSFREDHLALKPAALAGEKLIRYADIVSVEQEKQLLTLTITGQPKPLKLGLRSFNSNERKDVVLNLKKAADRRS